MVALYDLIESKGIDYVKSLPSKKIQRKFLESPPEDLVMYVITGLSVEELKELFTEEVVRKSLKYLPSDDLFTFLYYIYKDVERCFDKPTFHKKSKKKNYKKPKKKKKLFQS